MSGLGQLVAGVAHEINNPINIIHGNLDHVENYADNLLDLIRLYQSHTPNPPRDIQETIEDLDLDFIQKDLPEILESMKIGTHRIRQLVISLRNFSRMDESEFKTVDVHEGIESTLLILQHPLKSTDKHPAITIKKEYDPLPPIECAPGHLNQVFFNILENAIDALRESNVAPVASDNPDTEPPTITIRTSQLGDDWIEIEIVDNGPGMEADVRQRIFDPFFTTKPVGKGTGLSMSLSYQTITERHRGNLECYSSPTMGTAMLIRIPCTKEELAT